MSTYKIEIDFGSGYEEYDVLTTGFRKQEVLHKGLKPADSTLTFMMEADLDLYNLLRGIGVSEIPIKVLKDNAPYFFGYIRKTFEIQKTHRLQNVKVECVSPSFLLKRKISYDLSWKNITVTNLLTNLLTTAGVSAFTLPTINFTIPGFTCIANEGGTYHQHIEKLLFEYGYVFYFDETGALKTYALFPSDITTTKVFNGANCLDRIRQIKTEEAKEKVIVSWISTKTLNDAIVFSDTTNAQSGYKCLIELPPLGYLGDKEEWYAEFDIRDGEILSVGTVSLDVIKDADIEVLEFSLVGNRAFVSVKNNNVAVSKFIRKFDIIAETCVVKKDVNKAIIVKNPLTEKVETIETQYIYDVDSANDLANGLAWWYKYADFDYRVTSKTNYALGDIVTVSDTGIGTNTARIIAKTTNEEDGVISYELEAIDEYEPDVPTAETSVSTPPSITIEKTPVYRLKVNSNIVKVFPDDSFVPEEVVYNLESRLGLDAPIPYDGIFRIYVEDVLEYTSPEPTSTLVIDETNFEDFGFTSPLKDIQIMRVEFWDVTNSTLQDFQNVSFLKDVMFELDNIVAEVELQKPKYLGMFLDDFPTVFKAGDWFILYAEDDTPNQRGVYKVKSDSTFLRLEGDTGEESHYIVDVMPDLLNITSDVDAIFGTIEDYGLITFIPNLASNSVFTSTLRVGIDNFNSTLIQDGKIKTNFIDVNEILGDSAVFTGTIDVQNGIFRGSIASGPLVLNVSQPGSPVSFTTTSKKVKVYIDEVLNAGITLGKYNVTGTYNSNAVASCELTLSSTGTRTYVGQYTTTRLRLRNTGTYIGMPIWNYYHDTARFNGYVNKRTATAVFYNSVGTVLATVSGLFWAASTDYVYASTTQNSSYMTYFSAMSTAAVPPSTPIPAGDDTPTLATGSISYTAGTYTYRLSNLPGYSAGLPTGTVYVEADGGGNFILKVRG